MLDKFSALIGVNRDSIVEPEAPADCAYHSSCTSYPYSEGLYVLLGNNWVFRQCGC
ncbi:hypothetical protein [Tumebacillus lipolyticus]|uniref:Uncharacterized protein n=1 Tax=Tumebacillus lipolyticus TaxID=1280370 RepID=A0ABW4ZZF0_9BACL